MALTLDEDERMLVDSVRGFLTRATPTTAFRALRDSGDTTRYDPAVWKEIAQMGLIAPHVSADHGGAGMGYAGSGLIAEEAGRVLASTPFLSSAVAADLIQRLGSDAQKAELLPAILDGSRIIAFAVEESGRHDPTLLAAQAEARGNGFVLSGAKRFVVDGAAADLLIVAAVTAKGPSLFLVDPRAAGVSVKPLALIDNRNAADIDFADAEAQALLGGEGEAAAAIDAAFDLGRALLAAELLGMSLEAFERTIAYMKERVQFGVHIGSFQALQHRASRLHVNLELAKGVVLKALRALDEQDPAAAVQVSLAKTVMARTARETMNEAMQLHGGIGVTDEYDIGFFVKRARSATELWGGEHFHKERLAALLWKI